MMDFVTTLTAASQGLEILKALRNIDKGVDSAEWKSKLTEVQVALSDAKMNLQEAREEIAKRDAEIQRLEAALKRREDTVEYHGYRYAKNDKGITIGSPFCPVCLDKNGSFINLVEVNLGRGMTKTCPRCGGDFGHRISTFGY